MKQQQQQPYRRLNISQYPYPKRIEIFLHLIKTGKLLKRLFTDSRIHPGRKISFLVSVVGLAVILLALPLGEFALGTLLPIIGIVLGVPLDTGVDWLTFAMLVVSLLRIFPQEIVSEHYQDLFHHSSRRRWRVQPDGNA
uniref:Uncharacterized protein n=1 Tax=Thermosporothrix sp. COM3 TaxID=2490863 RepID=A0A455SSV8_9CHLR|nr:hypothetical protein KTC_47330 [Thermosporothrix sp. COM3]